MHLSEKNNQIDHVRRAAAMALNCAENWVDVADQDHGLAWLHVRSER